MHFNVIFLLSVLENISLLSVRWPLLERLMQCNTNRGHCCLTAGIKSISFICEGSHGCSVLSLFLPFSLFNLMFCLNTNLAFYQCCFITFYWQTQQRNTLNLLFFFTYCNYSILGFIPDANKRESFHQARSQFSS